MTAPSTAFGSTMVRCHGHHTSFWQCHRRTRAASSPGIAPAVAGRWEGTPANAACLDVGVARIPKPGNTVAFGVDRPLYYSVHSGTADLAPSNAALIHVAKYLDPSEPVDVTDVERELEMFLDRLQPGGAEKRSYVGICRR